MKPIEDFKSYFENELITQIHPLEGNRLVFQKWKQYFNKTLLAISILIALFFILGIFEFSIGFLLMYIFILVGVYTQLPPLIYDRFSFTEEYKELILSSISKFISDDINYSKRSFVPKEDFVNSKIYLKEFNSYQGSDLLEGNIDKTSFYCSLLNVEKLKYGEYETNEEIFKGLFFVADFNKYFNGSTVLLPNLAKNKNEKSRQNELVYSLVFGKNRQERQAIMEDADFSYHFICFTSDDVEARYILSPSLKKRIVVFKEKYPDNQICISFVDNKIFIAVNHQKDIFNVSLAQSLLNFELVKNFYDEIELIINIVEELNLNNRIWTKE